MMVQECLQKENTLQAKNLYESYKVGGLQLATYLEVMRDYVEYLEEKYPGIKSELYKKASS